MIIRYLPEDKVEISKEAQEIQNTNEDRKIPEWLRNVEGLNTFDGIVHCGGVSAFIDALTVFAQSVTTGAKEISDFFDREDWKNYTTKVHALKSSAKVIGANELSERAKRLEDAGNSGYINEIKDGTPELLKLYLSYETKLAPLCKVEEEDNSNKPLIDDSELAEAYETMKEVSASFDYDTLTFVLNSLGEYRLPESEVEKYKQIKDAAAKLDWETINRLLG